MNSEVKFVEGSVSDIKEAVGATDVQASTNAMALEGKGVRGEILELINLLVDPVSLYTFRLDIVKVDDDLD